MRANGWPEIPCGWPRLTGPAIRAWRGSDNNDPEPFVIRPSAAAPNQGKRILRYAAIILALVLALATLAGLMAWLETRQRTEEQAPAPRPATTIAILPFSNLADEGDAYLEVALADELTTLLSRASDLAVRPFWQSRRYSDTADLARAAAEMNAELLLTGQYRSQNDDLIIGLEVSNPGANTVVWRDRLVVPLNDALSLNEALANWVGITLLPELGIEMDPEPSMPASAQAYELYLRSLALAEDPAGEDHQSAKQMLERSLALDAGYAPAWDEFARRLYLDSQTANTGGERAFRRAEAAQQRALDIDPDLIEAATGLTNMRTERGELQRSYAAAVARVRELPRNALTHFSLSYVLRYMGRLEESVRECEVAYGLDPQLRLRSCSLPYTLIGNYRRAHDFLDLDADADWVANKRAAVLVREGRTRDALAIWAQLPPDYSGVAFWAACLAEETPETLAELSRRSENNTASAFDPEVKYWDAAMQAYCGFPETALRLLETAVDQNYCSFPAVDLDPLWEPMRDEPEFVRIRDKAVACHQRYR